MPRHLGVLAEQIEEFKKIMPLATVNHVLIFARMTDMDGHDVEMRDLPLYLQLPQATLNRTLRSMAERSHTYDKGTQLISITTSPYDERQRYVNLTDKGRALAAKLDAIAKTQAKHDENQKEVELANFLKRQEIKHRISAISVDKKLSPQERKQQVDELLSVKAQSNETAEWMKNRLRTPTQPVAPLPDYEDPMCEHFYELIQKYQAKINWEPLLGMSIEERIKSFISPYEKAVAMDRMDMAIEQYNEALARSTPDSLFARTAEPSIKK